MCPLVTGSTLVPATHICSYHQTHQFWYTTPIFPMKHRHTQQLTPRRLASDDFEASLDRHALSSLFALQRNKLVPKPNSLQHLSDKVTAKKTRQSVTSTTWQWQARSRQDAMPSVRIYLKFKNSMQRPQSVILCRSPPHSRPGHGQRPASNCVHPAASDRPVPAATLF